MLKFLKINNIAVIPALELEFGPGLSLLTGETGAGKSILIDALGLLLGTRASADLIRTGAEHASVEAIFEGGEATAAAEAQALPVEDGQLILRREIHVSGKGRATVNGAVVPVSTLRTLAPHLATIHGQHEPQGLLDPETHLGLLDHYAGLLPKVEAIGEPYRRLREAEASLASLLRDRRELERRRETLEFQASEIEKASLRVGEQAELLQEKALQANAGRLATLAEEAYALLYEDEASALARLRQIYRKVFELAGIDGRFRTHLDAREPLLAELDDLALFLRDYRQGVQVVPGRLDEIESRLALLQRLQRKYGASEADVLAFAARLREELRGLGSPEERERELAKGRERWSTQYLEGAKALSAARRTAARELEKKVEAELALLAMDTTRFQVGFEPQEPSLDPAQAASWTEHGLETAEFLLSPNPGEELRPLARIASGGELSRILLALNSVSSGHGGARTLVFDEVDAGIGGRVAEVVGKKLRALSGRHQVLCVTHLPQIASLADAHYVVRKDVERGRTITRVEPLDERARVEEVARMLGGEAVTDAARRHAREMVRQGLRL